MTVKMNLRIITKNHAADPEIGFLSKSISKPNGCATAMPTAWELRKTFQQFDIFISKFIGYWDFLMGFRIFSETLEFF